MIFKIYNYYMHHVKDTHLKVKLWNRSSYGPRASDGSALLILVVTVYSAPQNQDQNSIDRFSSLFLPVAHPKRQAITSFAPYDKSWETFKTVHSKFSRTTVH
jgi:hypothetical protein